VHRILHTANGTVDCASAVEACRIGAAKLSDYSEFANTPLDFDQSIPLPPLPTLLAGPTTGLVDGQSVALFGGGFPGNSGIVLQQCVAAALTTCYPLGGVTADADGNFITAVNVHRSVVAPPISTTDCASAPGVCILRAYAIVDVDAQNSVDLSFDPSGPPEPATLTVDPDTDLVQFQSVTAAGSGFAPSVGVQILQCKTDATDYQGCNQFSTGFVVSSAAGSFSTPISVRRILHLFAGDFDCASAPGACSLFASSYGPVPVVAAAALDFDSSVPLPPAPTISVTPDTGLVQGQSVTVTGSNFAPNAQIFLSECSTGGSSTYGCGSGIGGSATADGIGAFSATFTVQRGIRDYDTYPPTVIDCASAPQACSMQAFAYDGGDSALVPIDFDPLAPIVTPTVTVTPQFDLADRAFVSVHAEGFAPGDEVVISQCDADASSYGPGCSTDGASRFVLADASGTVDVTMRVRRNLTYYDLTSPSPIQTANCSDAVGECVIRAESYSDPLGTVDVPLGFDPTAVAPPPVLTVTPAGPWTDGQQVVVHGSGFTSGARIGMGECIADVEPNGHTCDSQPGGLFDAFFADDNGEFTRTITIHAQFQSVDAVVDCPSEPNGCVLLAANREDYGAERVTTPIVFAVAGATLAGATVAGESTTRTLAFTGAGSSTAPLAVVGGGALVLGIVLLVATRRRRTHAA
jgi:Neocarzinostatin family